MAAGVLLHNSTGDEEIKTETDADDRHWPVSLTAAMDGSAPVKLTGDATYGLDADVTRLPTGTSAAATTVAHDDADSGHPLKVGGVARDTEPAAVSTNGDRVNAFFDRHGRQVVARAPREMVEHDYTFIDETLTETEILAAGAAGFTRDLTKLRLSNRHATIPVQVTIKDADGGTVRDVITVGPMMCVTQDYDPPLPQAAAAEAWTATCSVATVKVDVFVQAIETGIAP